MVGEHEHEQFILRSLLPEICGRYTNWSAKIQTGDDNIKKSIIPSTDIRCAQ